MTSSDRPRQQELDHLLETLGPRIAELVRRHGCPPETAEEVIREALLALAHQWNRVASREWWLLDRIEKSARRSSNPSREEP